MYPARTLTFSAALKTREGETEGNISPFLFTEVWRGAEALPSSVTTLYRSRTLVAVVPPALPDTD